MVEFQYTIRDPQGLHARPAGQLAQAAAKLESTVTLAAKSTEVSAKRVIALMKLCLKQGDTVTFRVEGASEVTDADSLRIFCEATF